jgi:hypothetical protein
MKRVCGLVIALAGSALGQTNRFELVVSNTISPDQPSATIQLWTTWDPTQYAFAYGGFDLVASHDPGGFTAFGRALKGPGTRDGDLAPDGDSVTGVVSGQLQFDGGGGIFADTANPILVFTATWSTTEFTPRIVDLGTVTKRYELYLDFEGTRESFLDDFAEGAGSIQVVPAPASAALLLVAPLACLRRAR